jgi:hypothetical protein
LSCKRAGSAAADQPGKKKRSKARGETGMFQLWWQSDTSTEIDLKSLDGMDVDKFPVTAKAKKSADTKIAASM